MRRATIILLSLMVLMGAGPVFAQSGWQTYKNERFGFTFKYPAQMFEPVGAPANGDGQRFEPRTGYGRLSASGSFNALEQTPRQYLAWVRDETDILDEVTYSRVKRNWVVISGYKNGMIYYEKTIFSCGRQVLNSVTLIYPPNERPRFDKWIAQITKSLRPGIGYNSPADC